LWVINADGSDPHRILADGVDGTVLPAGLDDNALAGLSGDGFGMTGG